MCLAIPARIESFTAGDNAIVSLDGVKKEVSLSLIANAEIGDYVLVHVGFALNTISSEEAEKTLQLMAGLSESAGEAP